MQEVKMSKEIFDLFEKNTVLDYEQARWYTQKGGYIPIQDIFGVTFAFQN